MGSGSRIKSGFGRSALPAMRHSSGTRLLHPKWLSGCIQSHWCGIAWPFVRGLRAMWPRRVRACRSGYDLSNQPQFSGSRRAGNHMAGQPANCCRQRDCRSDCDVRTASKRNHRLRGIQRSPSGRQETKHGTGKTRKSWRIVTWGKERGGCALMLTHATRG